ncbi:MULTISPECIES: hypothetical protein [Tsukamurella]|uniref:Uncharacterized protein n=2 Tax=Tsukamurella TaxID=2060 RepID=A0A5C5S5I1_9ACTN|nr:MULTISPECIES: hypothetical protein [Tsukamurella]NMD54932.1 hypothetical protein [Tsukamurella columbiensis]TWS29531.1 hypothetical protein FK530_08385 [Tsukamurella conjunctivitidis]
MGVAHLLPATAALSRDRVERAYGVTVPDADSELLLRHRATFFGLLGAALLAGAAEERYRWPAIVAGTCRWARSSPWPAQRRPRARNCAAYETLTSFCWPHWVPLPRAR